MHIPAIVATALSALLLGGCAGPTALDQQFGQSVRLMQAQQTMSPQPTAGNPGTGVDGKVARSAYDNYQKSFRAPEPQPAAFTIGIGSGGSK